MDSEQNKRYSVGDGVPDYRLHSEADDNEIGVSLVNTIPDDSARVPLRDAETLDPNLVGREFKLVSADK